MASAGTARLETKFDTQNCQDGCYRRSCTLTVCFLYENKCFRLCEQIIQLHHVDSFRVWNCQLLLHNRKNLVVGYHIILALILSSFYFAPSNLNFAHVTDDDRSSRTKYYVTSVRPLFFNEPSTFWPSFVRILLGKGALRRAIRHAVHRFVCDRACRVNYKPSTRNSL